MARTSPLWPNVLVLEPEALSCRHVLQALQPLALNLQVETTLAQMTEAVAKHAFHLVVLGLDRDSADNLARVEQVRAHCPDAVIMGICPRMASSERCTLLNTGLDFILEKPFFTEECLSAVQAIFRRLGMDCKMQT